MIKSFDHVAITVEDLEGTIDWYVENLGFTVSRRIENKDRLRRIAFLEVNGHPMLEFFGLIEPKKTVKGPTLSEADTGIKHISFLVEDMEEMCQKLEKASVEFTTLTERRAVFKDPNGVIIEMRLSK